MHSIFNCGGIPLDLTRPKVMGILNITPDSFYDGGLYDSLPVQAKRVETMISEGASIIDVGAVSTRPGSVPAGEEEEIMRLIPALEALKKQFPDFIFSADTFRSNVAKAAIESGAGMINDIYGGRHDGDMFELMRSTGIPYIIMHMSGDPENMQDAPEYENVVSEVAGFFRSRLEIFEGGSGQVILDPGFGFGKTVEHNFMLLQSLRTFKSFGYPVMAGISRKSMINKVIQTKPSEALNGTTVLNTIALMNGADLLRVHDVKEAVQAIELVYAMRESSG